MSLDATIVVSSRDRPVRLRWLLNALEDQTLSDERFEVIVAHDSSDPETEQLLSNHPLTAAGRLRHLCFAPTSLLQGAKRNAAWRIARAPLILFTDDDCRPATNWVAEAVSAARDHPGAIVQGTTHPDPDENATLWGAPWPHTQSIRPPTIWAETCNIGYPRVLLERSGGFDPRRPVAEDTDLAARVTAAGARLVAAPAMVVYHAVDESWLPGRLRSLLRWEHQPWVVKRHPQLRRHLFGGICWKPDHAALLSAAAGVALARRHRSSVVLVAPWLGLAISTRGNGLRGLLRSVSELPGRAAIDATEIAVVLRGSLRYRTILL